jgi:hypothetical protein
MIFIKHLLPLVDLKNIDDSEKFTKQNIEKVNVKCHFKKKKEKQFFNTTRSATMYSHNKYGLTHGSTNGFISRDMALGMLYTSSERKNILPNVKNQNESLIHQNFLEY